jgi:hypothetical protein
MNVITRGVKERPIAVIPPSRAIAAAGNRLVTRLSQATPGVTDDHFLKPAPRNSDPIPEPSTPIQFSPVFRHAARPSLRELLDEKSRKLIEFVRTNNGRFLNRDLAVELGVDTPLTSIHLGHLTRKLQKVGVDGKNWYSKHRTTDGTLLTVRDDVMEKFAEAMST